VFDVAWTHSQVTLRQSMPPKLTRNSMDIWPARLLYGQLIAACRPGYPRHGIAVGNPVYGAYSISGDLPIVLLRIGDRLNIELVRQLVQATRVLATQRTVVDLVIWNEDHAGYRSFCRTRS